MTITLVALMLCGGLQAQYSDEYYHRTGDTIEYNPDNGYFMWWGVRDLLQQGHNVHFVNSGNFMMGVHLMPFFTPTPLKVIGIAGVPQSATSQYPSVDTTDAPEYFYLYDKEGTSGPIFQKRVQWDLREPFRYLKQDFGEYFSTDTCCVFYPSTRYLHLYECYFDTAVYVSDTFYIGRSYHSNEIPLTWENVATRTTTGYFSFSSIGHYPCTEEDTVFYGDTMTYSTPCFFPIFEYYHCSDTSIASNPYNPNLQWIKYRTRRFYPIYPIIQVDTTLPPYRLCDEVQNVQATADGDSCVVITWDDFYHYTYCNVQYYALEDGYNSAITETVSGTNMLRICDLDTAKTYLVRVNAFCDTSKIETDWSQWVFFKLPNQSDGIDDGASLLSFYTHLMPNPAAERVTVTSSFGLTRIEAYNMQGILIYSEPAGFTSTTVDLHGWAPGHYIMMIHTPQGVTAKRLTIAR